MIVSLIYACKRYGVYVFILFNSPYD